MSRLDCVRAFHRIPPKCRLRASFRPRSCIRRNAVTSLRKRDACTTLGVRGGSTAPVPASAGAARARTPTPPRLRHGRRTTARASHEREARAPSSCSDGSTTRFGLRRLSSRRALLEGEVNSLVERHRGARVPSLLEDFVT